MGVGQGCAASAHFACTHERDQRCVRVHPTINRREQNAAQRAYSAQLAVPRAQPRCEERLHSRNPVESNRSGLQGRGEATLPQRDSIVFAVNHSLTGPVTLRIVGRRS